MPNELHQSLIKQSAEAALLLGKQLNILLDAYDFYTNRYEPLSRSEDLELLDLLVSIRELGFLPGQVAIVLNCWRADEEPPFNRLAFEIDVINEFAVHLRAVASFMYRKNIDLDQFYPELIGQAFMTLRTTNRVLDRAQMK